MPDYRFHDRLRDRGDVDFPQRASFKRTKRRIAMWTCAALGFWPLLWQFSTDSQKIYWSHPVSPPHRNFASDCKACHASALQSVWYHDAESWREIENNTCRTCHDQHALDHHKEVLVASQAETCFDCHKEHQEAEDLLKVPDPFCTGCHKDLQCEIEGSVVSSDVFVREIPSFEKHPEFALRRMVGDDAFEQIANRGANRTNENAPRHQALALAELPKSKDSPWIDRVRFRFSHQHHLVKGGVPLPPRHPNHRGRLASQTIKRQELTCQHCHEPDAAGQYMKPIRYEQHCRECHPLEVAEELHALPRDLPSNIGQIVTGWEALPHDQLTNIRPILRERLTQYYRERPEPRPAIAESPRTPELLELQDSSRRKREAEWVEARLRELQQAKFLQGGTRPLEFPGIAQLCRNCHLFREPSGANSKAWTVVPPQIPDRWYPHARFSHARHDVSSHQCTDCHYKQHSEQTTSDPRADRKSIYHSSRAADVLMPSIFVCRKCHSNSDRPFPRDNARADCVTCHLYHHSPTAP